ncbi:NHLC1 ligase, partial [Formicarius rufipectus]|nr:NHLC1 ligase [Formicarius rufipectus]
AGMAAQDEAELSLLECRVCFEPYGPSGGRRPRNLPCGHVLCGDCLRGLAGRGRTECPFCRRPFGPADTSECRPLLQLLELLGPAGRLVPTPGPGLRQCLGGWGSLLNPAGLSACRHTGRLAVAHDGKKRIHVFGPGGLCLQRFGERGVAGSDVRYPLDVAVTPGGHVVVTDGGDRSVKAFDWEGRAVLAAREGFRLPWGVDATPEGEVVVSDSEAGALFRISADFGRGELKKCRLLLARLVSPRAVAVCRGSGSVAVVEHLRARGADGGSTRVKVFSADMQLLGQVDGFGLSLLFHSSMYATAVAFDGEGRVVVTDVRGRAVICLGKPEEFPAFQPLISHGLSYPVGLAYAADDSLVVLDGGDHSIKIYSST